MLSVRTRTGLLVTLIAMLVSACDALDPEAAKIRVVQNEVRSRLKSPGSAEFRYQRWDESKMILCGEYRSKGPTNDYREFRQFAAMTSVDGKEVFTLAFEPTNAAPEEKDDSHLGMTAFLAEKCSFPKPQEPAKLTPQWKYVEATDRMTQKPFYYATLQSLNTVNFGSPYSGAQRATLFVQSGGYWRISIERGQFICPGRECKITIRFDDKPAREWLVWEPKDHKTTVLESFLYWTRDSSECFIAELAKSKKLLIQATFYQEGKHVLEFDVTGFDQHPTLQLNAAQSNAKKCSGES
jgi:hypothetical protein